MNTFTPSFNPASSKASSPMSIRGVRLYLVEKHPDYPQSIQSQPLVRFALLANVDWRIWPHLIHRPATVRKLPVKLIQNCLETMSKQHSSLILSILDHPHHQHDQDHLDLNMDISAASAFIRVRL
jgi:hypothetical protein